MRLQLPRRAFQRNRSGLLVPGSIAAPAPGLWLPPFARPRPRRRPVRRRRSWREMLGIACSACGHVVCCCNTECLYRRAQRCCDDAYVDFAIELASVGHPLPFVFTYDDIGAGGGECWYVNDQSHCVDGEKYPVIGADDRTEYDSCEDCRVTCTGCTSEDDCGCCSPCDALTPTDFTVAVAGISILTTCVNDPGACIEACDEPIVALKFSAWGGGTFTVPQLTPPQSPCAWVATFPSAGPTVTYYSDTSCTTVVDSEAMDLLVEVTCIDGLNVSLGGKLSSCSDEIVGVFGGTATVYDCCGLTAVPNQVNADEFCAEDCAGIGGCIGTGGTAFVRPC